PAAQDIAAAMRPLSKPEAAAMERPRLLKRSAGLYMSRRKTTRPARRFQRPARNDRNADGGTYAGTGGPRPFAHAAQTPVPLFAVLPTAGRWRGRIAACSRTDDADAASGRAADDRPWLQ